MAACKVERAVGQKTATGAFGSGTADQIPLAGSRCESVS